MDEKEKEIYSRDIAPLDMSEAEVRYMERLDSLAARLAAIEKYLRNSFACTIQTPEESKE